MMPPDAETEETEEPPPTSSSTTTHRIDFPAANLHYHETTALPPQLARLSWSGRFIVDTDILLYVTIIPFNTALEIFYCTLKIAFEICWANSKFEAV